MVKHDYNFWVLVQPSADVPGEWIAHCLEVDVVTQGTSINDAFKMAAEATTMVVCEDLAAGRNPLDRRAPDEFWAELWPVVNDGSRKSLREVAANSGSVRCVAAQLLMHATIVEMDPSTHKPRELPDGWDVPALWSKGRDSAVHA